MTDKAQTDKYFEALVASYEALTHAIEQANERGLNISRQLLTDVTTAQRQALDLARRVAENPSDVVATYSAVMEYSNRHGLYAQRCLRPSRLPIPPLRLALDPSSAAPVGSRFLVPTAGVRAARRCGASATRAPNCAHRGRRSRLVQVAGSPAPQGPLRAGGRIPRPRAPGVRVRWRPQGRSG